MQERSSSDLSRYVIGYQYFLSFLYDSLTWFDSGRLRPFVVLLDLTPIVRLLPVDHQLAETVDRHLPLASIEQRILNIQPGSRGCMFTTEPATHCDVVPSLRWHIVAAIGRKVIWTESGLSIFQPAPNSVAVEYPNELEHINGSEWLGYRDDEWFNGAEPRYLGLTTRENYRASAAYQYAKADPLGRGGRLGHLGGAGIIIHGGAYQMNPSTQVHAIELIATTTVERDESSWVETKFWVNSSQALVASTALDQGIVFWGLWTDPGVTGGISPTVSSRLSGASIPTCSLPTLFNFSVLLPGVPLAHHYIYEFAKQQCRLQGFKDLEWTASRTHETVFPTPPRREQLWKGIVENGSFGARSGGVEMSMVSRGGFVKQEAALYARILDYISTRVKEAVLIVFVRCARTATSIASGVFCS